MPPDLPGGPFRDLFWGSPAVGVLRRAASATVYRTRLAGFRGRPAPGEAMWRAAGDGRMVEADKIRARVDGGVLTVVVPGDAPAPGPSAAAIPSRL